MSFILCLGTMTSAQWQSEFSNTKSKPATEILLFNKYLFQSSMTLFSILGTCSSTRASSPLSERAFIRFLQCPSKGEGTRTHAHWQWCHHHRAEVGQSGTASCRINERRHPGETHAHASPSLRRTPPNNPGKWTSWRGANRPGVVARQSGCRWINQPHVSTQWMRS